MSETKKTHRTITITKVDESDCKYIEGTGIPITEFTRRAIKEKRDRDSK